MKPAPNLAASFHSPKVRVALAWFLPFAACLLQWLLWPQIGPSRWFLFYPVVFFAPLFGGLAGGVGATLISALLVWFFFLPPEFSWQLVEPGSLIALLVFLGSGITFAGGYRRLLASDVNGDGVVGAGDVSAVKARSGQALDSANLKFDLNVSGVIGAADVAAVKVRIGRMLLP